MMTEGNKVMSNITLGDSVLIKIKWKRRVLCGLRNLISSSTHSSVVRGHIEFLRAS